MVRETKLAGFGYSKILVERADNSNTTLKISPSINISSIEKHKADSSKQDLLKIGFKFSVDYSGLGKIELEGRMFLIVDQKTQKEAIEGWKNKKLDSEINMLLLNIIMQKASLKALDLEDEMNLPLHVPIPRLQLGKKEEQQG